MALATSIKGAAPSAPLILHVSGDFPDPIEPFKTPVIRDLIDLTSDSFDHRVISINRVSPSILATAKAALIPGPLAIAEQPFEYGTAIRYTAPGKGLRHQTKLEQMGDWLVAQIEAMDRKPDLIMGHKLTIEGIVVRYAAKKLGLRYGLSIQGNTDTNIIAKRPDLRRLFASIYHEAEIVFPFTPWSQKEIEKTLGPRQKPTHLLPCPTDLDQAYEPRATGDGFVSVFHLKNYRIKNLSGIVQAWRILGERGSAPSLEIIGGGNAEEISACQAMAKGVEQIRFSGPMGRGELKERLSRATALVLPSLRESFGLVFVEALFAGTPIIYPRGTAVDGYFDDAGYALRVSAQSPDEIANAVEHAMAEEAEMKAALAAWQASPSSALFTRAEIGRRFESSLKVAAKT